MPRRLAVALTAVVAVAVAACDPPEEDDGPPEVPAGLLQPDDLPIAPGRVVPGTAVDDASASWGCAGVEQSVLLDAGWDEQAVTYRDVGGRTVGSSRFDGADDPAAALDAVSADVRACRDSLASEGREDAIELLDLGDGVLAYQSNDSDGTREGQRAYTTSGSAIVQVTVLGDDTGETLSLQTLVERAAGR